MSPHWWTPTNVASLIRYVLVIGSSSKRRWLTVTEPDFFES